MTKKWRTVPDTLMPGDLLLRFHKAPYNDWTGNAYKAGEIEFLMVLMEDIGQPQVRGLGGIPYFVVNVRYNKVRSFIWSVSTKEAWEVKRL